MCQELLDPMRLGAHQGGRSAGVTICPGSPRQPYRGLGGGDFMGIFVFGGVPCAVRALCEKLAVLRHREFGKFRRLKGRH